MKRFLYFMESNRTFLIIQAVIFTLLIFRGLIESGINIIWSIGFTYAMSRTYYLLGRKRGYNGR